MTIKKNLLEKQKEKLTEYRAEGVKKPSCIGAVGVMALAMASAVVSFGVASALLQEKLIGFEQFFDVVFMGPVLFCIWLLTRG
mgnify:FL=1